MTSAYFDEFERVHEERYQAKCGFRRPIVRRSFVAAQAMVLHIKPHVLGD